jgi:hypothetical protein
MRAIALALLVLTAGCTHVQYGSSTNGARVQVNGGNALGVVLVGAALAAGAVEDFREPPMYPTIAYPSLADWIWSPPPPPLAPDRAVSEQDCTKPVALTDNLRCR